jgi:hypothetical protein
MARKLAGRSGESGERPAAALDAGRGGAGGGRRC